MGVTHRFPAVPNAYRPSGKTTLLGTVLMFVIGGLVSVGGGYLFGSVLPDLGTMSSPRNLGRGGALVEFVIIGIASFLLGGSIALAIHTSARIGKNRNKTLGVVCGLTCGFTACAVILAISGGQGIGLLSGAVILCVVGVIPILGGLGTAEDPFCEEHNRFMEERLVRHVSLEAEEETMRLLALADFVAVTSLPSTDDYGNGSRVTVYHCPQCREGYLSMTTTVTRRTKSSDGTTDSESESRLVYSTSLNPSQVRAFEASALMTK